MFDYDGNMDRFAHVEDSDKYDSDYEEWDNPFYDPDREWDDCDVG